MVTLLTLRTGRLYPQEISLALKFMSMEKKPVTSSKIETPAFRIVAQSPFKMKYVLGNGIIQETGLRKA